MKKVIVGTGLLICGVLAFSTALLRQAIYYSSSSRIISDETLLFLVGGVFFIAGIVLCIIGIFENIQFENIYNEKKRDMLPQKKCPKCGKEHDMDYPKCPFCKHQY